MNVEGFCIPPDRVPEVWLRVSDLIREAMAIGLTDFAKIEKAVFAADMLLWIAWNGTDVAGAAVTQLTAETKGKIGTIVACAGPDFDPIAPLQQMLEDHFIAEGCALVRILGRPGWSRVLKGYRTKALVLEKEL